MMIIIIIVIVRIIIIIIIVMVRMIMMIEDDAGNLVDQRIFTRERLLLCHHLPFFFKLLRLRLLEINMICQS